MDGAVMLGVRVIITGRIIEDDAVVWVERVEAKDWENEDLVLEPRLESVACDGDFAMVGVLEVGVILDAAAAVEVNSGLEDLCLVMATPMPVPMPTPSTMNSTTMNTRVLDLLFFSLPGRAGLI